MRLSLSLLILIIRLLSPFVHAGEEAQGEFMLTIHVQSGPDVGRIPGADVLLLGEEETLRAITDSEGTVVLPVKPGKWKIKVSMHGFFTAELEGHIRGRLAEDVTVILNSLITEDEVMRVVGAHKVPSPTLSVALVLDKSPAVGASLDGRIVVRNTGSKPLGIPIEAVGPTLDPTELNMYLTLRVFGQFISLGKWFRCEPEACPELAPGESRAFPIRSLSDTGAGWTQVFDAPGRYEAQASLIFLLPKGEWIDDTQTETKAVTDSTEINVATAPSPDVGR